MDHLPVCNNLGTPEADFMRIWCSRCLQKECSRSRALEFPDRFTARTATWAERLFIDTPKMPETDPRFEIINKKSFEEVETWGRKTSVSVPEAIGPVKPVPVWDAPPAPASSEGAAEVLPVPPPLPTRFIGEKLPNQSGRMVGSTIGETILQPGARIRLGSGVSSGGKPNG
jgi:hypothetical protein